MASQITGVSIVCSTIWSGADQRKHQSPPHHWPLWGESTGDQRIPLTKGQWRGKNTWWRHHACNVYYHHGILTKRQAEFYRGYAQSLIFILCIGSGRILADAGSRPIQCRHCSPAMFTDHELIAMTNSNSSHDIYIMNSTVNQCLNNR